MGHLWKKYDVKHPKKGDNIFDEDDNENCYLLVMEKAIMTFRIKCERLSVSLNEGASSHLAIIVQVLFFITLLQ